MLSIKAMSAFIEVLMTFLLFVFILTLLAH